MDLKAIREQLAEIGARAEAATPGPWEYWRDEADCSDWLFCGPVICEYGEFGTLLGKGRDRLASPDGYDLSENDWRFIAAARQDVPWLVACAERLVAYAERLKADNARVSASVEFAEAAADELRQMLDEQRENVERLRAENRALYNVVTEQEKEVG